MSATPILFHDIDGVLFGEYAGEFQLRPGVKSWLAWAHEHFQVIWLTSWESDKIKALLHVLYCERFTTFRSSPRSITPTGRTMRTRWSGLNRPWKS